MKLLAEPYRGPALVWRALPWIVFCLALGFRGGYAWDIAVDPSDGYPMFHAVRGVPFSDAQTWDYCAEELVAGRPIPAHWAARRPLYSLLLALCYVWTGPSFAVAVGLNVLAGALSITLLYLLGARLVHPWVGLATACWATFDPLLTAQSVQIMSEAPGLTLLLAHLAVLIAAWRRGGWWIIAAGVLFSVSNLTRMLSLLALPGLLVCVYLLWRRSGAARDQAGLATAALLAGLVVVISPLVLRQWLGFGIVSMQDSTAAHLYAATSPKYGRYSAEIDFEATQRGLHDVAERYQYFMRQARANFWNHPTFFFTNLARNTFDAWRTAVRWKLPWLTAYLGMALPWGLWLERALRGGLNRVGPRRVAASLAACAVLSLWAWASRQGQGPAAPVLVLLAACWSLTFRRGDAAALCTNLALGTLLALGVFAYTEDRLLTMFQWIFVLQFFAAIFWLFQFTAARWLAPECNLASPTGPGTTLLGMLAEQSGWARWRRPVVVLLVAFVALSWNRLQWRRLEHWWSPEVRPALDQTQALELVHRVAQSRPALVGTPSVNPLPSAVQQLASHQVERDNGRWVVLAGRITRYVHYFPPGARTPNTWRPFHHRPYARSVLLFEGHGADRSSWMEFVVWPGPINPEWIGRRYVLVGRVSARPIPNEAFLVEGVALVPVDEQGHPAGLPSTHFAELPAHLRVLDELAGVPWTEPAGGLAAPGTP